MPTRHLRRTRRNSGGSEGSVRLGLSTDTAISSVGSRITDPAARSCAPSSARCYRLPGPLNTAAACPGTRASVRTSRFLNLNPTLAVDSVHAEDAFCQIDSNCCNLHRRTLLITFVSDGRAYHPGPKRPFTDNGAGSIPSVQPVERTNAWPKNCRGSRFAVTR